MQPRLRVTAGTETDSRRAGRLGGGAGRSFRVLWNPKRAKANTQAEFDDAGARPKHPGRGMAGPSFRGC